MTTTATVTTYAGDEMQARKLSIFAEMDKYGRIFYKTEAASVTGTAAVSLIYDESEALDEFIKVARAMLDEQKTKLLNVGE